MKPDFSFLLLLIFSGFPMSRIGLPQNEKSFSVYRFTKSAVKSILEFITSHVKENP
jgi:hypothetical protein